MYCFSSVDREQKRDELQSPRSLCASVLVT